MTICPFCKDDPFHYVDIGVGYQAVAINCCEGGMALYSRDPLVRKRAQQILKLRRSYSPRKKARAKKLTELYYGIH